MAAVAGHDFVIESGDGVYVTDEAGSRYLDATAGLWFCNIGHGRRELAEAALEQMARIAAYSTFGDLATRPTLDLADRLAALAPMDGAKVFLTSGGSDAVDTAVKLVRRYWALRGQSQRLVIITRDRSYHGMHLAGTSLAGIEANRQGYGDLDALTRRVAWDDASALAEAIDTVGAEHVAAFFCEPVIGAGGVFPPPPGYLEQVRAICAERGVLFVADEVICGYGRLGAMFASSRYDLDPDVVLTAKGLTSGYLPMGAVLVAARVAEPFWSKAGTTWRHGYTYSGHATAAAVAMANLDIIEGEHLIDKVRDSELALAAAMAPLAAHSHVDQVRAGTGLLAAVQLPGAWLAEDPAAGTKLVMEVRKRGVITRILASGALQISPAFVMTRNQMREMAAAIDDALSALGSTRSPSAQIDVDLLPEQTSDDVMRRTGNEQLLSEVPPHHVSRA
jgi:adenosylmethionine-8-amino-7-oxononanoate aminotransferase